MNHSINQKINHTFINSLNQSIHQIKSMCLLLTVRLAEQVVTPDLLVMVILHKGNPLGGEI